ncbi:MAG: hypothetical protein FWC62_04345 [Firmicutes bacterium]|nr:hypothetical protein [Bacillota bacterium]
MLALIDAYSIITLPITDAANQLANLYVSGNIIPVRFRLDGAHIAVASINGLDCVLSYNFKHINRVKTKLLTEHINHEKGYRGIVICTAKEVLEEDESYSKE